MGLSCWLHNTGYLQNNRRLGHTLQEFHPGYAQLSSLLGPYAGVLTLCEHLELVDQDRVLFTGCWLTQPRQAAVDRLLDTHGWVAPRGKEPLTLYQFAVTNPVGWGLLGKYDVGAQRYAMAHQLLCPRSDEFGCATDDLSKLGQYLYSIMINMSLLDCGSTTPRFFRMLTAVWFARQGLQLGYAGVLRDSELKLPEYSFYKPIGWKADRAVHPELVLGSH